jgi:hypothetical protein
MTRDRLEIVAHPYISWSTGNGFQPAAIHINGVDLLELVRGVESRFTDVPGSYLPMPASSLRLPSRTLLDQPQNTAANAFALSQSDPRRDKATVLQCTCGITECWFLLVKITLTDETVVWSDFEQFHRDWFYDLGPFTFDKAEYLEALGGEAAVALLS